VKIALSLSCALAALAGVQDANAPRVVHELGSPDDAYDARVLAVAFSADGARVAVSCQDGSVAVWDVSSGNKVVTLVEPDGKKGDCVDRDRSLVFTSGGLLIAAGGWDFGLRAWDRDGREKLKIDGATHPAVLSPDGKILAAAGRAKSGDIVIVDLAAGKITSTLSAHAQPLTSLAFAPDGKRLASASVDGTWRLWDVAAGKETARDGTERAELTIGPRFPHCVRWSPDGRHIAVSHHGCWSLSMAIVDAKTLKRVSAIDPGHTDAIAFSPDGKLLAYQDSGGRVALWNVHERRKQTGCASSRLGRIFTMEFTRDGKRLAAAGDGGVVVVWDASAATATGK
jgi:WD40 repeat protein